MRSLSMLRRTECYETMTGLAILLVTVMQVKKTVTVLCQDVVVVVQQY